MNFRLITHLFAAAAVLFVATGTSCDKKDGDQDNTFILRSSEIKSDSLLPADYTCEGVSATLPLEWSGEPDGTVSFVIIMHHEASPTDIHWYWILYNIPANVHSLKRNVTGVGSPGTNSVNGRNQYAPPCSQGPGMKAYTYTLYALGGNPVINDASITREDMLNAISGITLSSASMKVYFERSFK